MSDSVKPQNYDTCTVEEKKKESAPKLLPDGFCSPATHWVEFLSKVAFIFSYKCVSHDFASILVFSYILTKYLVKQQVHKIKFRYSEKATKFEKISKHFF